MIGELKTFAFDIDGTLCTLTGGDYKSALPFTDRVDHVNKLFDQGHHIKLFTARGATSGKDFTQLTKNQLDEWGVKYNEVIFGKPHADLFIDDKAVHSDTYHWD